MTATTPSIQSPESRGFCTTQISTGTSGLSDIVSLQGNALCSVMISTGWTAANLTFQTSVDGSTTFQDHYDESGTEYTLTVGGASRNIKIPIADFAGVTHFKFRSGTTALAVAQAATRTLTVGVINLGD